MKLDVRNLRLMSKDDFRVLTAIEMGMRNHEYVPFALVSCLAGLAHGKLYKIMSQLGRFKLIAREQKYYEGYRLTYGGYDFLALRAMVKRGNLSGIGRRIGVGKESDIYLATNADGDELAIKLHRLGRISFRRIKEKRDYLRHRKHTSWLYLSRLAALKEYAFMQALHAHGFPVPEPLDSSRHCILMRKVDGYPLHAVKKMSNPGPVFDRAAAILKRLARCGLVHCDFNEFNLMVSDYGIVTLIDFPQMISVDHPNAESHFQRDADGLTGWFAKKYGYEGSVPGLEELVAGQLERSLDVEAEASGFSKSMQKDFESLVEAQGDEFTRERADTDADADADADDEDEDEVVETTFLTLDIGSAGAASADHSAGVASGGAEEAEEGTVSSNAFAVLVPPELRSEASRERRRVPVWRRRLLGRAAAADVEAEAEEVAAAAAAAEAIEADDDGEAADSSGSASPAGHAGGSAACAAGGSAACAAAASAAGSRASDAPDGDDESEEEEEGEDELPEPDAALLGRVPDGLRSRLHGRGRGKARGRGGGGSGGGKQGSVAGLSASDVRSKVKHAKNGKKLSSRPAGKALRSGGKAKSRKQAQMAIKEGRAT